MKIIFFGTSEFAVPILQALTEHFQVSAVVTQPDRPSGRDHALSAPPVKKWIMDHETKIPILQPEKLDSSFQLQITNYKPDVIVLASYGKIIPKSFLEIPPLGWVNVHPSLLPRWRGASPIQSTILHGDEVSGVTILQMDHEMDHGPILGSSKFKIQNSTFTYKELQKTLAEAGAKLIVDILPEYAAGKITPTPQNHSQATFCKLLKKEGGHIDWNKPAEEIERQVRAYDPWPGTYTFHQTRTMKQETLKILKTRVLHPTVGCANDSRPGYGFMTENKELAVNCTPGSLVLEQVQPEGKRSMSGRDFVSGHQEILNTIFS